MSDATKESSDLIGQRKLRIEKLNKLKQMGFNPFPSKSAKDHTNYEIISDFNKYENNDAVLAGRLMSWREHGAIIFGHIQDQTGRIQVYIKNDTLEETNIDNQNLGFEDLNLIDVGDVLEVSGTITKTPRGEISILAKRIKVLTKAVRPLPSTLEDKEERFRRRYLDMTIHPEVRQRFERRARFWEATREFLNKKGFYEVNIPVLEHTTGGADAKPFVTHYDALNQDFFLRISHELPLKRLIGGGFEKVYDLGPRFRNEGFSDEHLPEHVAMEFYWAYANYKDGMELIKEMYRYVMMSVYGKLQFTIKGFEIDLSKEWEEIDYLTIIKERFGVNALVDPVEKLNEILKKNGVDLGNETNRNRVVDNLWKVIRKTIAGPAFLVGVPKFMSPLAKTNLQNELVTDRFQPVIAGSELGNGYSELNDPIDQLERFTEQEKLRDAGDDEAQMLDIDFVEMLEYGMPPTVGWGHSERVFWFFENVSAKEGVPFPQLKHDFDNVTKEIYKGFLKEPSAVGHQPSVSKSLPEKVESQSQEMTQDFSKKMIIVVNEEIQNWQKANAISHVAAYLGHKLGDDFKTADFFITSDGIVHPRNSQYAIIILSAKPGQMGNFMNTVRESNLLYHGFIKEMIETTNDSDIVKILSEKKDSDIEYYAVGVFGDKETLDKMTKKYSLFK